MLNSPKYKFLIIIGLFILLVSTSYAQETPDTPYTSTSGGYTVMVPGLWIATADEQGVVTFADSVTANFLFSEQFALEPGQLVLQIFAPNSVGTTPQMAMDGFINVFEIDDLEPEEIRVGRETGLRLAGESPYAAFAFTTRDGDTGFAVLFYSQGELEEATDRTVAVLETITTASLSSILSEAPAEQLFLTYENESLGISFDYPTGWGIDDTTENHVIYIANEFNNVDDHTIDPGRLSSRMYLLRPSVANFRLDDNAALQDIADSIVQNDRSLLKPEYIEIDNLQNDALVAYENVMSWGEVILFLLRLDESTVLVWRVRTEDGEAPRYYSTLKSILATVEWTQDSQTTQDLTDTQFDMQVNLRDEFKLDLDLRSGLNGINSFALSPDETVFAITIEYETDAYLLDAETGNVIHQFVLPTSGHSVSFSPDSETLMVISGNDLINLPPDVKFFDVESGESLTIISDEFEYSLDDGMFTSDGSQIVLTGSVDTIYDANTGERITEISTSRLIADSAGQYFAHANLMRSEQHLIMLEAETQQILSTIPLPEDIFVEDMRFSPNNRWLGIVIIDGRGSDDRTIIVDVENKNIISETQNTLEYPVPNRSVGSVNLVAFAPNMDVMAVSMSDVVTFYEVETGIPLTRISLGNTDNFGIAFTADGQTFYTASDDNIIRAWDVEITEN